MKENPGTRRRHKARKTPSSPYPAAPPKIVASIEVVYHSVNQTQLEAATAAFRDRIVTSQILYKPGLLAMARVTFQGTRWEIHHERDVIKVIPFPNHSQMGEWERNLVPKWDNMNTRSSPEGVSFYVFDNNFDFSTERFETLQEEFIQFLISNETLELVHNPYLKIYRKIDESEGSFFEECLERMGESFDLEMKTLEETVLRQQERLKERLDREVRELGSDPADLQPQIAATATERKRQASSNQEEMDTQESMMTIDDTRKQLSELQVLKEQKVKEFEDNLNILAREQEKDILRVNRANVEVLRLSLVWLPYTEFVIQEPDRREMKLIQSF